MCVVMNFWNHHISEVRIRVQRLSITCLKLTYMEALKRGEHRTTLKLIVNLKLFKAFAGEMFWSVPYKYFAYLAGLEFYAQLLPVSKVRIRSLSKKSCPRPIFVIFELFFSIYYW